MSNARTLASFAAGAVLGGLVGGVAGYVLNDLTSRENPEVMAEIEAEQQLQDDFEAFLDQLAATPPAGSGAGADGSQPTPQAVPPGAHPSDAGETHRFEPPLAPPSPDPPRSPDASAP